MTEAEMLNGGKQESQLCHDLEGLGFRTGFLSPMERCIYSIHALSRNTGKTDRKPTGPGKANALRVSSDRLNRLDADFLAR